MSSIIKYLFILFITLLVYISYFNQYTLIIRTADFNPGTYRVSWKTEHTGFGVSNSVEFPGFEDHKSQRLALRSPELIKYIKISIPREQKQLTIKSIEVRRFGYKDKVFKDFTDMAITRKHNLKMNRSREGLIFSSKGKNPFFVFPAALEASYVEYILGLIILVVFLLAFTKLLKLLAVHPFFRSRMIQWFDQLHSGLSHLENSVPRINAYPHKCFLLVGAVYGSLMIALAPPFQSPDGFEHFYKSCTVSYGNFIPDTTIALLPKGVRQCSSPFEVIPFHTQNKASLDMLNILKKITWQQDDLEAVLIPNMTRNPAVLYIPQAAGIGLCRKYLNSPLVGAYFGRLFNLLFYVSCFYFIIHLMPFFKWTMTLIALMPMPFFLATSLSGDSINTVLLMLFLAVVLKLAFAPGLYKNVLLVSALLGSVLIGSCKPGYTFFLLLIFLVPQERFKNRTMYFGFLAGTFILGLGTSLFWNSIAKDLFVHWNLRESNIEIDQQLSLIISDPVLFARVMAQTIHVNGIFLLESCIGRLGWIDVKLPSLLLWGYAVGLAFVSANDIPVGYVVKKHCKVIISMIVILTLLYTMTGVYLSWNSVGKPLITGLQGRYFITLIPLVLLAAHHNRQEVFMFSNLSRFIAQATILFSILITLYFVLQRYWHPIV